jgi:ribonuclease HI
MSTEKESSIPLAELAGIILALRIANEDTDTDAQGRDIEIYTDNQGALQTLRNPRQSSGQYLVTEIVSEWEKRKASNKGRTLNLYWIPGHIGVSGNELADVKAKEVAG